MHKLRRVQFCCSVETIQRTNRLQKYLTTRNRRVGSKQKLRSLGNQLVWPFGPTGCRGKSQLLRRTASSKLVVTFPSSAIRVVESSQPIKSHKLRRVRFYRPVNDSTNESPAGNTGASRNRRTQSKQKLRSLNGSAGSAPAVPTEPSR